MVWFSSGLRCLMDFILIPKGRQEIIIMAVIPCWCSYTSIRLAWWFPLCGLIRTVWGLASRIRGRLATVTQCETVISWLGSVLVLKLSGMKYRGAVMICKLIHHRGTIIFRDQNERISLFFYHLAVHWQTDICLMCQCWFGAGDKDVIGVVSRVRLLGPHQ